MIVAGGSQVAVVGNKEDILAVEEVHDSLVGEGTIAVEKDRVVGKYSLLGRLRRQNTPEEVAGLDIHEHSASRPWPP